MAQSMVAVASMAFAALIASRATPKSSTLIEPSCITLDVRRLQVAMNDALRVRGR